MTIAHRKPYGSEEEARRSKAGRNPYAVIEQCLFCDGAWHVTPKKTPTRLRPRSAKTAAKYVTRRAIVAELFAEPSICEVPWCTDKATDPHEPLTRARGGDILDRSNIRKVCHAHNVLFASEEKPWMYEFGFLRHSWEICDA